MQPPQGQNDMTSSDEKTTGQCSTPLLTSQSKKRCYKRTICTYDTVDIARQNRKKERLCIEEEQIKAKTEKIKADIARQTIEKENLCMKLEIIKAEVQTTKKNCEILDLIKEVFLLEKEVLLLKKKNLEKQLKDM